LNNTQQPDMNTLFPEKKVHFFTADGIETTETGRIIEAVPDHKGTFALLVYDLTWSVSQEGQMEKHLVSGYTAIREFRISIPSKMN
jgi:hypothetical protein